MATSTFCLFIYIFAPSQSLKLVGKYCDLQTGDLTKLCYVKETLAVLTHSPNQLAVDKTSNTLYFSFDFGQGEYVPAILRIKTKNLTVLQGPKDAFAIAVNDTSGEVYFGGSHGVYKYNSFLKSLKILAVNNLDIWWLHVKNQMLYFIRFPSLQAFCYHNRTLKPVERLLSLSVQQFIVDDHDNIFFINSTGLYGVKNDSKTIISLKNDVKFIGMAIDNKGDVFASAEDGIYIVNRIITKVKRVVNIPGVLGLTFDKNNYLIYSDSHEINRLVTVSAENYHDISNSIK
ncbi:ommochrome-binding protein-like [Amyelois transitella]|uniref:ommochrome-binding protein-like n=1 Tax=Amyelois transitella TaxID=680683 RepID=UPI00067DA0F6|nr:ommochrome-binding protein-like [Amyelois transitella]